MRTELAEEYSREYTSINHLSVLATSEHHLLPELGDSGMEVVFYCLSGPLAYSLEGLLPFVFGHLVRASSTCLASEVVFVLLRSPEVWWMGGCEQSCCPS